LITNKDNTSAHFYEIITDNLNIKNISETEVIKWKDVKMKRQLLFDTKNDYLSIKKVCALKFNENFHKSKSFKNDADLSSRQE